MTAIKKTIALLIFIFSLPISICDSVLFRYDNPDDVFVIKKTINEQNNRNNFISQFTYDVETTINNKIEKYTFENWNWYIIYIYWTCSFPYRCKCWLYACR